MAVAKQIKNGSFAIYWNFGDFAKQEDDEMRPIDLTGETTFKCTDHKSNVDCTNHEPFFKCASHKSCYRLHFTYNAASSLMKLTLNIVDGYSYDCPQAVTALLNEESKEMCQTSDGQWGPVEFDFSCQYAERVGRTQKFLCTFPCLHLHIEFLPRNTVGEQQILGRLAELFDSKEMADVVFAVKGQVIKAHSVVVASGCPILSGKCEQEASSKLIYIDDVEPEVFREMLRFVYTGKAEAISMASESLYLIADKYQLETLKSLCEEEIISKLTVGNVIHYLVMAFHHNSPKLLAKSLEMLAKSGSEWQNPEQLEVLKQYPALFFPLYLSNNALQY